MMIMATSRVENGSSVDSVDVRNLALIIGQSPLETPEQRQRQERKRL
jgi:hypothetical protein